MVEGLPKRGGLEQFADLRGGLVKKRGWCFLNGGGSGGGGGGGLIP